MELEGGNCAYLDNYKLVKTLGQGYHAKVKLGIDPNTNKYVALKIFKKTHEFEKNRESLTKEFQIMQGLNHPNLINLIDVKPEAQYKKKNGQTYKTMAIILEYAGAGELFEYVSNCGRFSEEVARTYFQQMVEGLSYLHNQGICHRDMKPENLLYDDDFILKIADFGFAKAIAGDNGDGLLRTILGTESYMCPEIHQKVKYEGASADLFAAGIILFILFTGHPPFMKADPKDPYYKLLTCGKHATFWKAHSKNKPQKEKFFPPELIQLFNTLFAYNPQERASMEEIKANSWFNGPTKTQEVIKQEFLQRQQVVERELEAQRQAKLLEKQKQKQDYVFAGVGKFRSGEEVQNEFSGLDAKYPNINNNSRKCKSYDSQFSRGTDFLTVIDPEYLIKVLLSKDNEFCKEAVLSEDSYKLKCLNIDNNGTETRFNIQFLRKDEETICVDFQKLEGCSIDFCGIKEKVKTIIKEINEQSQQQQEA